MDRDGIPLLCVLLPHPFRCRLPRSVRIQAQINLLQVRIVPEVGIQRAVVETAKGHGAVFHAAVEGAVAHQVYRGFKHEYPELFGRAGEAESSILIAAGDTAPKRRAVLVIGPPHCGEYRLTGTVFSDKNAVMVCCLLVQQSSGYEIPNDLGRNAPLL